MRRSTVRRTAAVAAALSLAVAACGSDDDDASTDDESADADSAAGQESDEAASGEAPTIAVTTNILGDVVEEIVGDSADVVTIMPIGADPHDFQASAQEIDALMSADMLIVNGLNFEEGLLDVIDSAEDEGIPTFEAASVVETIEYGEGGHDHGHDHGDDHDHGDEDHDHSDEEHGDEDHDHSDEEHGDEDHDHSDEEKDEDHDHGDEDHDHGDEEHGDEDHDHGDEDHDHSDEEKDEDHDHGDEDHDHGDEEHGDDHDHDDHGHSHSGDDPHFFTDPMRMAAAVEGIVDFLQAEGGFGDPDALDAAGDAYIAELTALDEEVAEFVASIPEENRVLVTNHQVFGYFAERYGFEVAGAAIPSIVTTDSASAAELAELAEVIEAEGVPAIFSDTSASDDLIQALAAEVGDVDVVALFTESLGDADSGAASYLEMVRTNAERISSALA